MKEIDIPNPKTVEKMIISVFELLFPNSHPSSKCLEESSQNQVKQQLANLLPGLTGNPEEVSDSFVEKLAEVKKTLVTDARFILESDPAATQLVEVIAIYPGFFAIFCYRIAHVLSARSVSILPRMITEYAHRMTGIDIHPSATIGSPFSIDHGTGIVIGETTRIGNNVKIYQGVTLGALSVDKRKTSQKRHPTIGDNVILYAGCTILGGETTIGRNSIIGGNVWLTESVAPYSVVYHKSEIIVKNHKKHESKLNFRNDRQYATHKDQQAL